MSSYPNWLNPVAQALSRHAGRLGANLTELVRQLHDWVSTAVGRATADAIRQAIACLLGQSEGHERGHHHPRGETRHSSPWSSNSSFDEGWTTRPSTHGRDDPWDCRHEVDDEDDQGDEPEVGNRGGLRSLLAAGCRMLAWWLGRLANPGGLLTAMGVAITTGLSVWLAGSAAGPGSLASLTDFVSTIASTLSCLSCN